MALAVLSILGNIATQKERNPDLVEYISVADICALKIQRKLIEPPE